MNEAFEEQEQPMEPEELRRALLDDLYACAFCGYPVDPDDEDEILRADPEELKRIAWRYGRS